MNKLNKYIIIIMISLITVPLFSVSGSDSNCQVEMFSVWQSELSPYYYTFYQASKELLEYSCH